MARKLLRTRATDDDRDLIVITDEGYETNLQTMAEALDVINVLANKVRAFYAATGDSPAALAGRVMMLRDRLHELGEDEPA